MNITESERLLYRKIDTSDFEELKMMLSDARVMYAWEHTFSDEQIYEWINKQKECYKQDGVGYFVAINKDTGELVGQIGLHSFPHNGETAYEVCYMLKHKYFHHGYALEGARAMINYAFSELGLQVVYAQIKTNNNASMKVAEKAGFKRESVFIKHYNGKDMPHYLFVYCM